MRNWFQHYWKYLLAVLVLVVITAQVLDKDEGKWPSMNSAGDAAPALEQFYDGSNFDAEAVKTSFDSRDLVSSPPAPEVATKTRHIIQTGNLDLIVADVESVIATIKQQTSEKWNGFVSEANVSELDDDTRSGWISIRVPADQLTEIMDAVKELAIKVSSENTTADDVTTQVTDSEARLKNLRAQEEQYREILGRAASVEDTLQATEYLNRVRGDIESLEAQLKNLNEQVALSTLNISLTDEGEVKIFGIYWRPLVTFKQAARDAIENITGAIDFLIELVVNLPLIAVLFVLVWVIGKYVWRWGKRMGSRFH